MKKNWQLKTDLKATRNREISRIHRLQSDSYNFPFLPNVTFFGHEYNKPGYDHERDNVLSYLFCYTENGSATVEYLGETFTLKKGDFMMLDLSNHSLITSPDDEWNIYFVHARSGLINDIYQEVIARSGLVNHSFNPDLFIATINKMLDEFEEGTLSEFKVAKYINDVCIDVLEQSKERKDITDSTLKKIVDYMDENYAKGITLWDVCKNVGLSNSYLSRLFYKKMGTKPLDYLFNLKIKRAVSLLKFTRLNIEDIAISSGFGTGKNMYTFFRKKMNTTPTRYRKEMGNKSIVRLKVPN